MGQPKLILPIEEVPLIVRTIRALQGGGASPIVVVVPPDDVPGAGELAEAVLAEGAELHRLREETPDMRATIEHGIDFLVTHLHGSSPDAFLIAPADCPDLSENVTRQLIALLFRHPKRIIAPTYNGKRGHPIVLPWSIVSQIRSLPIDRGLNSLIQGHPDLIELPVNDQGILCDLDTLEEYQIRLAQSSWISSL